MNGLIDEYEKTEEMNGWIWVNRRDEWMNGWFSAVSIEFEACLKFDILVQN